MKNLSLTLILALFTTLAIAQSDEVYLTSGDTLKGKVDILLPSDFFEEIQVKTEDNKRRLKSFQMLGFKTNDQKYKVIKFGDKYRIMEELISGYLGLYRFRTENSYDFGSRFLYKATNEGIEVPNITFKKTVANFLSECPSVQTGVRDKTYKNSNIEDMVAAFNACLNDKPQSSSTENEEKVVLKVSKELDLIQSISKKLNKEGINDDLSTLLKDLESKISRGEKVPGYLVSALRENTQDYKSVSKDVKALLDLLK